MYKAVWSEASALHDRFVEMRKCTGLPSGAVRTVESLSTGEAINCLWVESQCPSG